MITALHSFGVLFYYIYYIYNIYNKIISKKISIQILAKLIDEKKLIQICNKFAKNRYSIVYRTSSFKFWQN